MDILEKSGILDHYWVHVEKLSLKQQTRLLQAADVLRPPVKNPTTPAPKAKLVAKH